MKAGLLIVFFLTLYVLLGLYNYTETGLPNGSNDFLAHWAIISNTINSPEVQNIYGDARNPLSNYPDFLHTILRPFTPNPLWLWVWAVIAICLIAPALIYKLAGDFGVVTYFALSLPHMTLYNFTFPSFTILVLLLVYLLNRKNILLFLFLAVIASQTHSVGLIVFAVVTVAELGQSIVSKTKLAFAPAGFLTIHRVQTITDVINIFLNHVNFYFIWVARKSFNTFFAIIFVAGIVGAIVREFRVVIISQIILSIVCGLALQKEKPTKKFWAMWGFLILFNTASFVWLIESFIFL